MWHMKLDDAGEKAFIGPSGNFCFPVTSVVPVTDNEPGPKSSATPRDPSWSPQYDETHIVNGILDLFEQFLNSVHFFVDYDTLVDIRGDDLRPELSLVRYAAIAAGSLLSDDEASQAFGSDAASAVDAIILPACRQYPSVWVVQALAIMCWRELGLENHNMAWMYNSMSASMALHLGLPVSSLQVLEGRSEHAGIGSLSFNHARLAATWSSLLLDRIATSLLGRNCIIPWKRVRAASYTDSISTTPSLEELAFDYHCRLWFTHDQCMDQIYSFEFNELGEPEKLRLLRKARDRLLAFDRSLDTRLYWGSADPAPPVIILHMSYNMSQILIHRPYLKSPAQSSAFQLSMRTISAAATAMVKLIRDYMRVSQMAKAPPFVVHSIMTAAVTHLLNATSSQPEIVSQSISRFCVCFDALITMRKRWPKARKSISLLQELAKRWHIMHALPLHGFPEVSALDSRTSTPVPCEETPRSTFETTGDRSTFDCSFGEFSWAEIDPANFVSHGVEFIDPYVTPEET